jgi:D-alanine-D-alanine ligase-like ATP-grasp enzyme
MTVLRNQTIEIIEDVLSKKGYVFHSLSLGSNQRSYTQICHKDGTPLLTVSSDNPLYPFAASSARLIAKDKMTSYDFVSRNEVMTPQTLVFTAGDPIETAMQFLSRHETVIVKPMRGADSRGLTLDVTTPEMLEAAIQKATEKRNPVLIQRQFYGEEVRFAVINGKVKAVILREKPKVIGDGISTVRQLIAAENEARRALDGMLVPYPQLDESIIDPSILENDTVIATGEVCELNKSTMIKGGASIYDIFETIDKAYIEAAERAAKGIGKGFIVVDMMLEDYAAALTNDNYVFIEFNMAPTLSLFYSCRDGSHVPIVEEYLGPMIERAMLNDA